MCLVLTYHHGRNVNDATARISPSDSVIASGAYTHSLKVPKILRDFINSLDRWGKEIIKSYWCVQNRGADSFCRNPSTFTQSACMPPYSQVNVTPY